MIRCAYFEYYATGEGFTYGIIVGSYRDDQHTKSRFITHFGEYFERCAEYKSWDDTPARIKDLLPLNVKMVCDSINEKPCGYFEFHSQYHVNLS